MKRSWKGRSFCIAVIFILSIFFLTGCGFKDIDKRTFVLGIGIDPSEEEEGHYKITLKLAATNQTAQQSTGPAYTYLTYEGESLAKSIRMLETHLDKVLDFGHAKFIIINEQLLGTDLKDFSDYLVRRGDIQLISWVAAARPTAEVILKVEPETESKSTLALFNFFDETGTETPFVTATFLFEFRRDFLAKGIDAVLPLVKTNKDKTELIINQAIVVNDQQKPLELTSIQTKQFNTTYNKKSGFSYKVESDGYMFILNIESTKMKYKIITEKGRPPRADIKVKMVGSIGESNKTLALKDLDKYNKVASKEMKKKVMDLFKTLQENEVDPFGFGLRYRATRFNQKNTIDKWESMYPELEFDVTMSVKIKSTGAIE